MYGMTKQFNEAILGDTRKFHARIKSGELESADSIKSIKSYSQMTSNSYITIGGAYSSYVTMELWNPGFTLENREFQLEIGLEFDNGEIEWCPIGKYTAESPKTSIDGMITLAAYDCIQSKLSGAFFSNLSYPTDAINVLNEIAQKTGVKIITTNLTSGVMINSRKVVTNNEIDVDGNAVEKVTYENPFNGYTYKEALGYIAMLYCKYAVTDKNGAVVFKWYSEVSDYKITSDEFFDDFETSERAFAAGKITCNTGESELSAGSGENNIQLENPVMTQDRLNYIYEVVKTLEFIPSLFSFYGDIRLELGDMIKIEKSDGTIYSVPIMNISQDFDGGLKTSIQSYGGAEQENSTKSPLLNRLDRQYTELLLVKSLVGEKANFDYVYALSGEYKTLKADYGGFKELVAEDFESVNAEIKNVKANNITTDNLDAALANIDVLTAVSADLKYATIQSLDALNGKFDTLSAKAITTDNLSANVAVLGYATVDELDAKYAKIETLETEYLKLNDLSAKVATLGYATIKQLEATDAKFDKLNTQYASIDLANIDTANIDKAKVATLFAEMGLISTAVIEEGHVTGYLDSVEVNANRITAGTLSVDRLIINGSDKSLVYALNNAGELVSTSVDTLDGDLLTKRTVTADKLVAHSITANEITTSNIIGASGWINLAQGTFNYKNQISWDGKKLYIAPENIEIAISGKYSTIDYVDSSKDSAIASAAIDAATKADAAQTAAIATAAADATSKADSALTSAKSYADTAVDGVQVGGRNLFTKSKLTDNEKPSGRNWDLDKINDISSSGFQWTDDGLFFETTNAGVSNSNGASFYISRKVSGLKTGDTVTFSADVKGTIGTGDPSVRYWSSTKTNSAFYSRIVKGDSLKDIKSDSYIRVKITVTLEELYKNDYTDYFCIAGGFNASIYIKNIKLERGTKATDWTPAPEDTDSKITSLETWKTEASQKITKDGIIATVGNYYAYQSDLSGVDRRLTEAESTIVQQAGEIALATEYIAKKGISESNPIQNYIVNTAPTLSNYPTSTEFFIYDKCSDSLYCSDELICGTNDYYKHLGEVALIKNVGFYYIFERNTDNVYGWRRLSDEEVEALADKYASISVGEGTVNIVAEREQERCEVNITGDGMRTTTFYCC